MPSSPLALLDRRRRETPEAPWLFFPAGLDWRWHSWSQVADRVARAAGLLPPGDAPVAFRDVSSPDAVAADLAIQLAGRRALPLAPDAAVPAGAEPPPVVPPARSRLERWPPAAWPPAIPSPPLPLADGGALEAAALIDAVAGLALGGRPRPILLSDAPVASLPGRLALAAALGHGAAWALAPQGELLSAFAWTRPTAVVAPSPVLHHLLAAARDAGRWRRLATVITDATDPAAVEGWAELGVRVEVETWSRLVGLGILRPCRASASSTSA